MAFFLTLDIIDYDSIPTGCLYSITSRPLNRGFLAFIAHKCAAAYMRAFIHRTNCISSDNNATGVRCRKCKIKLENFSHCLRTVTIYLFCQIKNARCVCSPCKMSCVYHGNGQRWATDSFFCVRYPIVR
jgi:hypothetical protein